MGTDTTLLHATADDRSFALNGLEPAPSGIDRAQAALRMRGERALRFSLITIRFRKALTEAPPRGVSRLSGRAYPNVNCPGGRPMPSRELPQREALVGPLRSVHCDVPRDEIERCLAALRAWDTNLPGAGVSNPPAPDAPTQR